MDVDRVPEDFPTIQAAVDEGDAPVILVGPGRWAGAALSRPVEVRGDGAVVDRGVTVPGLPRARAAFTVPAEASGAAVVGFEVDCRTGGADFGVYGSVRGLGSVADGVAVVGNVFLGCVQAVTNSGSDAEVCATEVDGGRDWTIRGNHVEGLRPRLTAGGEGGGIGFVLHNASGALVAENTFAGPGGASGFVGAAVATSGCIDCAVVGNAFAQAPRDPAARYVAVANVGATLPGAARTAGLAIVDNDASLDRASGGIPFVSVASTGTVVEDNVGEAWVRDLPGCPSDAR